MHNFHARGYQHKLSCQRQNAQTNFHAKNKGHTNCQAKDKGHTNCHARDKWCTNFHTKDKGHTNIHDKDNWHKRLCQRQKDTHTFMPRTDDNIQTCMPRTDDKLSHQGQPKHKLPCQGQRTHKLPCQGQRTHKLPCQGQRTHKLPCQGQRTHKLDVNPRQSLPTTPSGQLMEQVPCWPQSSSHRWCFLPGTAAPTCSAPWAPGIPLACLPLRHGRMCQTSSGCHCPCSRPVTTGWQTV